MKIENSGKCNAHSDVEAEEERTTTEEMGVEVGIEGERRHEGEGKGDVGAGSKVARDSRNYKDLDFNGDRAGIDSN